MVMMLMMTRREETPTKGSVVARVIQYLMIEMTRYSYDSAESDSVAGWTLTREIVVVDFGGGMTSWGRGGGEGEGRHLPGRTPSPPFCCIYS